MAIAREVWGLESSDSSGSSSISFQPRPLDSYDDNNFFLPGRLQGDGGQGDKYLLKVQNGVESARPHILASQNAMMAALHGRPTPERRHCVARV